MEMWAVVGKGVRVVAADVVVVGGGIAGASLAWALARNGLGVTVLEASSEYPDRVRGECMVPWGFREARDLGVADVLLAAGAHVSPVWRQYTEGIDEVGEMPMAALVPDIPGQPQPRSPASLPSAHRRRHRRGRGRRARRPRRQHLTRTGTAGLLQLRRAR